MELLNGLSCRKFVAHGPARSGRVRAHRGRTPCHHQGQHLGSFAPNQQGKSQRGEKHVAGSPKDPDIPEESGNFPYIPMTWDFSTINPEGVWILRVETPPKNGL